MSFWGILFLIELLTKLLLKPDNWFLWSFHCSIFNIHSSINQVFHCLGIKHVCFCKQDNDRNCAQKRKGCVQEVINSLHTLTSPTLSKEIWLCPCNWSGFITDWDAVPIQNVFRCALMLPLSHLPNYMQMISDVLVGWTFLHKVLNFFQLQISTCFEATWVMKDKCHITLKYHFILNIMLPSLLQLQ